MRAPVQGLMEPNLAVPCRSPAFSQKVRALARSYFRA